MKCPQCGHDNREGAQSCGVCSLNLISGEAFVGAELPRVGFGEAIKRGFTNYFTFSGRSTRAEYWWWTLFIVVPPIFLRVLDSIVLNFDIGLLDAARGWAWEHPIPIVIGIVLSPSSSLFFYATVIPTIAMTSRRLHDVGISGWWQAAWLLMRVFSVGILEGLYFGSLFSSVERITSPVLPGTIPHIVMDAAAFLAVDLLRDNINFFLPNWVVGVVLSVWVIVWTVRRSDDGPNKYGPDPRTATSQQPSSILATQLLAP